MVLLLWMLGEQVFQGSLCIAHVTLGTSRGEHCLIQITLVLSLCCCGAGKLALVGGVRVYRPPALAGRATSCLACSTPRFRDLQQPSTLSLTPLMPFFRRLVYLYCRPR